MKAKKKPTRVRNVLLAKVNENGLLGHMVDVIGFTREQIEKQSVAVKVELYCDWIASKEEEARESGEDDKFGECEECGAHLLLEWGRCVVCGVHDGEVEPPEEETSGVITVTGKEVVDVQTTGELDEAVGRIKSFLVGSMRNYWNLGVELFSVYSNGLYKKRLKDDGKPTYKTWDDFVEAECGMSGPHARTIMVISQRFSEDQVEKLGVEKLRTIASLPTNHQAEMLQKAETLSTRQLAKAAVEVRRATPASPLAPPTNQQTIYSSEQKVGLAKGTEAAKKARERKAAVESGNGLSAIFQIGEYDLPLTKIEDGWAAKDVLVNGAVREYTIKVVGKQKVMHVKMTKPKE